MTGLHAHPGPTNNVSNETRLIGRNLRQLRRSRGLTQIQFAELLGVSQPLVSRWESGSEVASLRMTGKMTHIFLNKHGILNRSIDRLVAREPRANIFGTGKNREGFLHVGDNGCRFHGLDRNDLMGRCINELCQSDWKADIFGGRPMDELVSWQHCRDLIPRPGSGYPHVRVFSHMMALELDGHDRIHVNLATFTDPTGEPPQLLSSISLADLRPS